MSDAVILANQTAAEQPKSSVGVFELPCGLLDEQGELHTTATLREISGKEEDMLASPNIANDLKFPKLIAACLESLGPITDPVEIQKAVHRLPVGDRVFLLIAIRRVTLGNRFFFSSKCKKCGEETSQVIDLGTLDVVKMTDPKKRVFDTKTPSGREVRFHTMTGRDEQRLSKVNNPDVRPTAMLWVRMDLLDGKVPEMGDVQSLSYRDRLFLRQEFNKTDGGVDTAMELTCNHCLNEASQDLNIAAQGFFFPSADQID